MKGKREKSSKIIRFIINLFDLFCNNIKSIPLKKHLKNIFQILFGLPFEGQKSQKLDNQRLTTETIIVDTAERPRTIGELLSKSTPSLKDNIEDLGVIKKTVEESSPFGIPREGSPRDDVSAPSKFEWRKYIKYLSLGHLRRKGVFLFLVSLILLNLIGSSFVVGLLLSKKTVNSSGLVVTPIIPPSTPPLSSTRPPPPEPTIDLEIYNEIGCVNRKTKLGWGDIIVGGSVSKMIYIKNTGSAKVTLSFTTENWKPAKAYDNMELTWGYNGSPLKPGEVVGISLTLKVGSKISGINNFSFDIVFIATAS